MNKSLDKNLKNRLVGILLLVTAGVLFLGRPIYAADLLNIVFHPLNTTVMLVVGTLAQILITVIGAIITVVIWAVIHVANYNNFINETSIIGAWVIIRDFCNMLFILVLLVISFATILRLPSYEWKKLLPKLLIMAVLINFSRTICGLIIDVTQIIMLTFINAVGDTGGNYINTLGVQKYLTMVRNESWGGDLNLSSTVMGIILGVMFLTIATVVMIAFLGVLVMRIVMLWVYIVLSPLAFLLSAFPQGQTYAKQWWSDFIANAISGPILAFFLWLSLISAGQISSIGSGGIGPGSCFGPSQILCPNEFVNFVVAIGMLIGGLVITQKAGGMAGDAAGRGLDWAKKVPRVMGKGALVGGSWAARKFAASKHGFEIRPSKVIAGFKETLEEKKRKEDIKIEQKSAAMLKEGKLIRGGLGASRDFSETAAHGFLWNRAWRVSKDPEKMGIMQSTWKIGSIRKNIAKLEKERDDVKKPATPVRKVKIADEINKQREELGKYKTPQTFYAQQKALAAYEDAAKKSGVKDNEEEIVETFDKAMASGNNELAVGMILHAAEVSHGNEMIQMHKALADVYDDNGNVVTKKGESFRQGNSGMRGFFQQYVMGKMGLSEQEAFSIQSQFSSRAKEVNHFNLSESVGVKNGLFFQRSDSVQQGRAHGESMKVDVETLLRRFNRIGWGDEIQYEDESDLDKNGKPKIKRRFTPNSLTVKDFLKLAPSIRIEIKDRGRLNPNLGENLFLSELLKQKDAAKFPEKTLVEIMSGLGTSFTSKEGQSITHKQLALEAAVYGGDKYIGNLSMEKLDKVASGAASGSPEIIEIEGKIAEAEKLIEDMKDQLSRMVVTPPKPPKP